MMKQLTTATQSVIGTTKFPSQLECVKRLEKWGMKGKIHKTHMTVYDSRSGIWQPSHLAINFDATLPLPFSRWRDDSSMTSIDVIRDGISHTRLGSVISLWERIEKKWLNWFTCLLLVPDFLFHPRSHIFTVWFSLYTPFVPSSHWKPTTRRLKTTFRLKPSNSLVFFFLQASSPASQWNRI